MSSELAEVLDQIKMYIIHSASPWADRAQAAAYCCCSVSEIDKAANAGHIKRHWRNRSPVFKKHGPGSLDAWIESGKMPESRKL